jgi:SAM-dependent methyltransferase
MKCVICNSANTTNLNKSVQGCRKAQVIQCHDCGHAFLHQVSLPAGFYEHEFNTFMADRAHDPTWNDAAAHFDARLPIGQMWVERLKTLVSFDQMDTVVELGSSSGFFLSELKKAAPKLQTIGVEPGKTFREFADKQNIPTVESLALAPTKVDAVISFFVLEHIIEAESWLKTLRTHVKPGGVVISIVPNVEEALLSVYQDPHYDQFAWQAPHVSYFSEKSLTALMARLAPKVHVHHFQRYTLSNHLNWLSGIKPKRSLEYAHISSDMNSQYKKSLEQNKIGDTLIGVMVIE